ncbi:MAG: hypothetical protein JWM99_1686 [Verrucomicrobiales bacterium]|nr:hypothetical protein [Verrucomicrobiales bacterium]
MSWYSFKPYVSAAERRRKAEAAGKKMASKFGRSLAPIALASTKIAATFWGKAWCDNLESYSDYASRLPRGRSYVRNGSVIDLQITKGKVEALVQGSELYKISIKFSPLISKHWSDFKTRHSGKVTNLLDLLQGRLSKEILSEITAQGTGLFPHPKEITLECSCPDWADMCKHVAAVLYGVGARLDNSPELFFALRGVDMEELISAASETATAPVAEGAAGSALEGADLADIFGVEIESSPTPPPQASKTKASKQRKPVRKKALPKKQATKPKAKAPKKKPSSSPHKMR